MGAFDQEHLFVGTAFLDESRQSLLAPGSVDFGKPLSEFVGSARIHIADSYSEHRQSLTWFPDFVARDLARRTRPRLEPSGGIRHETMIEPVSLADRDHRGGLGPG
jgi:hypothetical protein